MTLNATRRFPFPDGSFDYAFSEHQMEHIGYQAARFMLRECYRILRSGGKIRIAVPSVDQLVQLYQPKRTDLQEHYIKQVTLTCYPEAEIGNPCFALNASFLNWGHKFLYDRATLTSELEKAGFRRVQFFLPGESDDSNLKGLETRTSETDVYETMVAQAARS
jgi:predicted SAM-dependent methyltransferase